LDLFYSPFEIPKDDQKKRGRRGEEECDNVMMR
jgi:hypothetical protein